MEMMKVKNQKGSEFTVRLVRKGNNYGLNNCLTHNENEILVEVYDAEYAHTEFGQFISRYYITTLLDGGLRQGINLYGGEPKWSIDANNWCKVLMWLAVINEGEQQLVDAISGKNLGRAADVWAQ
jgi:hypothetical protein